MGGTKLWIFCAGIGSSRSGLHPVQERLARAHGSQCGFCTPGFVMSMYSLLRSKASAPTEEEIEENLAGNLWCGIYENESTDLRVELETYRNVTPHGLKNDTQLRGYTKNSWQFYCMHLFNALHFT